MPLVPVLMKKIRLQEHIKWAAENETLDSAYKFLKSLAHDDGLGLNRMISSGSATGRYELRFQILYKRTCVHQ